MKRPLRFSRTDGSDNRNSFEKKKFQNWKKRTHPLAAFCLSYSFILLVFRIFTIHFSFSELLLVSNSKINSGKIIMLSLNTRLSVHTTRILSVTSTILRKEQKRNAALTLETLNPLVKEVEYAVRGGVLLSTLLLDFCNYLLNRTNCDSCRRYRKSIKGTYKYCLIITDIIR